MKKLIFSFIIGLLVSSCASHHGTISSGTIEKRIEYVDMAIGVSQTKKICGIGGMTKDALVLEAKKDMIKNRPLQPNEQYFNFTLDFKNSFWPIVSQTKAILSADVVKPASDNSTDVYSERYLKLIGDGDFSNELFSIGDSVLYKKTLQGTILSIQSNDRLKILYKTKQSNFRIKTCSIDKIYLYKTGKSYKGYKVGDGYAETGNVLGEGKTITGYVYGLGIKNMLIKQLPGEILEVEYPR
ncbi:DUF6567 family protein [Geofilum sp. OHC36d9]|uniref:DUF6567 family protein n=1 Tax=Geofilum sp. OHC36d9 TaxID=3458413 RepID=UPI004033A9CD